MIFIIAALGKNRVIGKNNQLLWNLPADLQDFHNMTVGRTVVMGLNTYKSVGEKPLPNRKNVVLTDDKNHKAV